MSNELLRVSALKRAYLLETGNAQDAPNSLFNRIMKLVKAIEKLEPGQEIVNAGDLTKDHEGCFIQILTHTPKRDNPSQAGVEGTLLAVASDELQEDVGLVICLNNALVKLWGNDKILIKELPE